MSDLDVIKVIVKLQTLAQSKEIYFKNRFSDVWELPQKNDDKIDPIDLEHLQQLYQVER